MIQDIAIGIPYAIETFDDLTFFKNNFQSENQRQLASPKFIQEVLRQQKHDLLFRFFCEFPENFNVALESLMPFMAKLEHSWKLSPERMLLVLQHCNIDIIPLFSTESRYAFINISYCSSMDLPSLTCYQGEPLPVQDSTEENSATFFSVFLDQFPSEQQKSMIAELFEVQ